MEYTSPPQDSRFHAAATHRTTFLNNTEVTHRSEFNSADASAEIDDFENCIR
jgi:hypothetical protein